MNLGYIPEFWFFEPAFEPVTSSLRTPISHSLIQSETKGSVALR